MNINIAELEESTQSPYNFEYGFSPYPNEVIEESDIEFDKMLKEEKINLTYKQK